MLAFEGIVAEPRSAATARPTRRSSASGSRSTCRFRPCPVCKGARLKPEVLAVTVGGRNIHEFTQLSVTRALEFLDELELTRDRAADRRADHQGDPRAADVPRRRRRRLPARSTARRATLSGGEAQRLRLATQIGSQLVGVLYILDEPSIGLHQRDNDKLIGTLERLRDLGNTVLVVEHDEQMMRSADWLVDMGPGAGEHGGHVVAEGTAREVAARTRSSVTGQFLSGKRADRRAAAPHRTTTAASASAARRSTT